MKNSSSEGKPDSKIHVRKQVAGGATGALLGAVVAGPIGAVVGGALGTMLGNAAEQGRSLEMPQRLKKRGAGTKVRARARNTRSGKTSGNTTARGSTRSAGSAATKKSSRGSQRIASKRTPKK